jgi:holo-[acyl-carrier protein] synthase
MIGLDVVDVPRFRAVAARRPSFPDRFFTPEERRHARRFRDPLLHLAGTFAAKEAVLKSLRVGPAVAYARRVEIVRDDGGAPHARFGGRRIAVSVTHDGAVAAAIALACADGQSGGPTRRR